MLLLPSINDFSHQANDPTRYARLPQDWAVAVADVVASTKLAEGGRDRDVNFIAGAVVAVLSALAARPEQPAACQFGGDGAVAVIPPEKIPATRQGLAALAHWAAEEMDIPLRVGLVPVSALEQAGVQVLAALQDFGNDNVFGQFLGSGIPIAETWVKSDPSWQIAPQPGDLPGLEGLSCRWRPIAAQRGHVYCYIIDPRQDNQSNFQDLVNLIKDLEAIVSTETAAPLGRGDGLTPGILPSKRSLAAEGRTVHPWRRPMRYARAIIGTAILGLVHRAGGSVAGVDSNYYRQVLAARSDYRKQAGGPRFVLDLTDDEAAGLCAVLNRYEENGRILYGVAQSDFTTLTCMVGDFTADRHVHFVDGDGLGFWRASVMLKSKYRDLLSPHNSTP